MDYLRHLVPFIDDAPKPLDAPHRCTECKVVRFGPRERLWVGVLSIAKLAAGQQHYYVSAVAKGVEDYYTGKGEAPGEWLPTGGSGALALNGRVADEDLHLVLTGADPRDGAQIIRSSRRIPGFDATFSAPKSVSLLYALGDADTSKHAVEAHDAAVAAAVGYLERVAAFGRRGAGGAEQIATSGLVAAAFRHRTSRTGDPQLHTHVLIANMARGVDARWSSLDGRLLLLNGRTAGYLYQAHLRAELTRPLGVSWKASVKGMAELDGVPTSVLRAFSRRRAEIEARVLVTNRLRPLRIRGHIVHQIGVPYHWSSKGLVRGDAANDLISFVGDPNVSIQESKALTADIRAGRRSKGRRRATSGPCGSRPGCG